MSCTEENNNIARVVRGNDFTLVVEVKQAVLNTDGETVLEDFDLSTATDVEVNIVSTLGKKTAMAYTTEGSKVLIAFDETVKAGLYGVEVTGKTDGADWRFYAKPEEGIKIVEPTSEAYIPEDSTEGYYNLTAQVGVISLPDALIKEAVEKATSAADNANSVAESVSEAESKRVEAENGRVSAESARVEAENARSEAETARDAAETDRQSAESSRATAEAARIQAETERQNAENERQTAEAARVTAESERASEYSTIKSDATSATDAANTAAQSANTAAEAANNAVESMAATYTTCEAVGDTTEYDDLTAVLV